MASQPAVVVTLDGELHDPSAPLLYADDLAAVRGDGIFETLLVRDGRPCLLEAHLARLTQSARMTDLPVPDLPRWRAAVAAGVEHWIADRSEQSVLPLVYWSVAPTCQVADRRHHALLSRRSRSCPRASPTPAARVWPR
jgi:4-amino-4-deoxychorismate lyase